MPMITTNDLKNGMTLDLDDGLFQVVEFQHVKPGKGGAFVRTTLKNVRNGAVVDRTFRAGEKVERAMIDKREMQFLYRDGDDYVFMDNTTYDQINVGPASLGDAAELPGRGRRRRPADVRRRDRRRRPARRGRAQHHRDRARAPGRPGVGRPQAGHPRDRPGRAGAAVRRARATASRSTPAPASTSPGREPLRRTRLRATTTSAVPGSRREARERALGLLYEAETEGRGPRPTVLGVAAARRPSAFAVELVHGRRRAPRRDRRARSAAYAQGLDARAHARASTGPCCASASSSWRTGPTCPPARSSPRRSSWPSATRTDESRPVRQRRAARPSPPRSAPPA